MKKTISIAVIAIIVSLTAGNFYYTYQASKQARIVYQLAYANVRDGYMDAGDMASVKRFLKREHSIMYPVRSYEHLSRMRENLLRIRHSAIEREMHSDDGTYCALYLHGSDMRGADAYRYQPQD